MPSLVIPRSRSASVVDSHSPSAAVRSSSAPVETSLFRAPPPPPAPPRALSALLELIPLNDPSSLPLPIATSSQSSITQDNTFHLTPLTPRAVSAPVDGSLLCAPSSSSSSLTLSATTQSTKTSLSSMVEISDTPYQSPSSNQKVYDPYGLVFPRDLAVQSRAHQRPVQMSFTGCEQHSQYPGFQSGLPSPQYQSEYNSPSPQQFGSPELKNEHDNNDVAFKSLSIHCDQVEKALDQARQSERAKDVELSAEKLRRSQAERDGAFFNQQMLAAQGKEAAIQREVNGLKHTIAKKDKELKKKQTEIDTLKDCKKKYNSLKRKAATLGKSLLSVTGDDDREAAEEAPAPKRVKRSPSEEPESEEPESEDQGGPAKEVGKPTQPSIIISD
ncbi:uncharacterized protein PAC_18994 [Phialocephala subalpina]|uniref:Uncharacterized protein n=1 Tax=Phialocephala subalpina TaxID=576137 RepID=A0A1L7XVN0_9HELO|nr:uncharacterized protein PAC_18994 [Phialocephala subalpina]